MSVARATTQTQSPDTSSTSAPSGAAAPSKTTQLKKTVASSGGYAEQAKALEPRDPGGSGGAGAGGAGGAGAGGPAGGAGSGAGAGEGGPPSAPVQRIEVSQPHDADEKEAEAVAKVATGQVAAPKKAEAPTQKKDAGGADTSADDKGRDEIKSKSAAAMEPATCPDCGSEMKPEAPGAEAECTSCGTKASDIGGTKGDLAKVMRKASGAAGAPLQLKTGDIAPKDGGEPLAQGVRSAVEPVVGADLSGVRVHSGEAVQKQAGALGAKAFTTGSHIFLGEGASQGDTELMAHEATHVVQQQSSGRTPVQRDLSDYVPQVVKDAANKAGEIIEDVIPDSILNLIKGKKSEAESATTEMSTKAEAEASAARTEGEGVDAQAQAPADQAVESSQTAAEGTAAETQQAASDAVAQTEATKEEANAKGAEMGTAGPTADWATDPVASITDPAPSVPSAAPSGAAPAPAQASAPAAPAAAQAPAPAAAQTQGPPPPQAQAPQTGGGAPQAVPGSAQAPDVGADINGAAQPDSGAWNCDEASVVAMVTKKGKEAVAALTRVAKSVVPEEVWNFASEKIASAQQKIAAIKQKVADVEKKISNFVEEKTRPLREAAQKAEAYLTEKYDAGKAFVQEKVEAAKTWASEKWEGLKTKVSTGVDSAITWAKSTASSVLSGAKNLAGRFWSMVPGWIKSPIEGAVGLVESGIGAVKKKAGDAKAWLGEKATAFGGWAKSKADGAVQWFATKYVAAKEVVTAAGEKIGEGIGWVKQKGGELASGAYQAVDNLTGNRLSKWQAAAAKKIEELKGTACGVAGDIAGPCAEKALPEPADAKGKSFAKVAVSGDVTVPVYGVPLKIAAGSSITIERTSTKYIAKLSGEASAGVSVDLSTGGGGGGSSSGGGGGGGATLSGSVEGSLPNKAKALMKLNGGGSAGIPGGISIPLITPGANGATPAAPGGSGAPTAAPAPGGGGGGAGAKASAEASKKLKIEATYEFDASKSMQNTCDGLGGLVAFLGANGAAAVLPQPFSAMAAGAAGGMFADKLTGMSATWSDTGKVALEAEIKGWAKGGAEINAESGVQVGIKKVDGAGEDGKPNGKKETQISARLYKQIGGKLSASFVPQGIKLFEIAPSVTGSQEVTITYQWGDAIEDGKLNASAKLGISASLAVGTYPGAVHDLPPEVKGAVMAQFDKYKIPYDANNATISLEASLEAANLAALASALDAELMKGEGASAGGVYDAVAGYFKSGNVKRKLSGKLTLTDKILGAKLSGKAQGVGAGVGIDVTQGTEIPLFEKTYTNEDEKKDPPKDEPPKEPPKDGPPKEEPPKKDPPKDGPPKEDPPKKDPPKTEKKPRTPDELDAEIRKLGSWGAVKAKWGKDEETMKLLIAHRKQKVDALVADLQKKFPGLQAKSLGSTTLTSDYDITFSGPSAVQAVIEFNKQFTTGSGYAYAAESGMIYDTNVYAQNFLQNDKPKEGDPDQHEPVLGGAANQAKDDANMDVAALIKVRKNMTQPQWDAFVESVVGGISDGERATSSRARFAQADTTYKTVYVKDLIAQMEKSDPEGVANWRKQGKDDMAIVDLLISSKGGIAAANRAYEQKLLVVEKKIKERDELLKKQKDGTLKESDRKRLEALSLEIRQAHSDALLFANEPYFAAGTIRHVVGNIQGGYGLDVGANEHFQSFNENYGDTVKELNHLSGQDTGKVLVQSSKYVYRFLDAATNLEKQAGVKLPSDTKKFMEVAAKLLDIRQGKSKEDPIALGKSIGINSPADLEKKVSELARLVNTNARSSGAGGSS